MSKFHRDTKGFTGIEALLIIVVIILVGFVGWYIYHKNHETPTNTTSIVTTDTTLKIPVLGISLKLPASLKGISYLAGTYTSAVNGSTQPDAYFSIPSYTKLVEKYCPSTSASPLGYNFESLGRDTGIYPANAGPNNSDGPLLKQFNTFYIVGSGPNQGTPCKGLTQSQEQGLFTADKTLVSEFTPVVESATLIQ